MGGYGVNVSPEAHTLSAWSLVGQCWEVGNPGQFGGPRAIPSEGTRGPGPSCFLLSIAMSPHNCHQPGGPSRNLHHALWTSSFQNCELKETLIFTELAFLRYFIIVIQQTTTSTIMVEQDQPGVQHLKQRACRPPICCSRYCANFLSPGMECPTTLYIPQHLEHGA